MVYTEIIRNMDEELTINYDFISDVLTHKDNLFFDIKINKNNMVSFLNEKVEAYVMPIKCK